MGEGGVLGLEEGVVDGRGRLGGWLVWGVLGLGVE